MSGTTAGVALSVFHLVGIFGTLLVPALLRWVGDARWVGAGIGVSWLIYFSGLYFAPAGWVGWMVIGGIAHGAGLGLGLTLVATRPVDVAYGRHVSGMVQGIGYGLAAAGPVFTGWLAEITGGWGAPTAVMVICALTLALAARQAGDPRPIGRT